jgi:hypothetical protein
LNIRPKHGMWAGIWIDGNLAEVEHYLRDIANPGLGVSSPLEREAAQPNLTGAPEPPAAPTNPAPRGPVRSSMAGAITARSSGHCEVMAVGCLLTTDGIATRVPGLRSSDLDDPATCYAVCRQCRSAVTSLDSRLAQRLGYLVDESRNAATVPFYWRQTRWVLLDSVGRAVPCSDMETSRSVERIA